MPINKDLREFVALLNSNGVEYLVVGALAVAFHGYARFSQDLDILVRRTEDNAEKVISVLRQFGCGSLDISPHDLSAPDHVVQLGFPPNRIDLITSLTAVSFEEAWSTRETGSLAGVAVPYIGRAALLQNKESTGRAKDLVDAMELRKLEQRS